MLVTTFVGLVVLLPFVLDPNDYKEKIESLVYKKNGYQLHIPADIGLQITPGLDVLFSFGQIEVALAPAFGALSYVRKRLGGSCFLCLCFVKNVW